MTDELARRQEECVQLGTVLANMDAQPMSFMSRIGDLPEPEEIFTAYETQKNVIKQLKDQVPILRKKWNNVLSCSLIGTITSFQTGYGLESVGPVTLLG